MVAIDTASKLIALKEFVKEESRFFDDASVRDQILVLQDAAIVDVIEKTKASGGDLKSLPLEPRQRELFKEALKPAPNAERAKRAKSDLYANMSAIEKRVTSELETLLFRTNELAMAGGKNLEHAHAGDPEQQRFNEKFYALEDRRVALARAVGGFVAADAAELTDERRASPMKDLLGQIQKNISELSRSVRVPSGA